MKIVVINKEIYSITEKDFKRIMKVYGVKYNRKKKVIIESEREMLNKHNKIIDVIENTYEPILEADLLLRND